MFKTHCHTLEKFKLISYRFLILRDINVNNFFVGLIAKLDPTLQHKQVLLGQTGVDFN
jgi:hypothetical protein